MHRMDLHNYTTNITKTMINHVNSFKYVNVVRTRDLQNAFLIPVDKTNKLSFHTIPFVIGHKLMFNYE